MGSDIELIDHAHRALQEASSLQDVVDIRDRAEALRAYARSAHKGLQAQNYAASVKLRAERKAGEMLVELNPNRSAKLDDGGVTLSDLGISPMESHRWQKLARVEEPLFEQYITDSMTGGKELTQTGALKLAPVSEKREQHSNAQVEYATPGIDIGIAREFGMEIDDALAELFSASIAKGIENLSNPKHGYVWTRYHGITNDGMGERWTFEGIAKTMNCTREYVESLYYRASHHVLQQLCVDLRNQLRILIAAE